MCKYLIDLWVDVLHRCSKKMQKLILDQCLCLRKNAKIGGNCKINAVNSKQIMLALSWSACSFCWPCSSGLLIIPEMYRDAHTLVLGEICAPFAGGSFKIPVWKCVLFRFSFWWSGYKFSDSPVCVHRVTMKWMLLNKVNLFTFLKIICGWPAVWHTGKYR